MDLWVLILIILVPVGFVVLLYNRLVALRQTRNNAFSDIDVQLKQRFNLIPQLVETVKGYAAHEKEVFENVTEARAQVGNTSGAGEPRMKAEGLLGGALMGLLAVAEDYPQLQADQNFRQLMAELSDIENKIAAARRFFNSATNEFNTAVQQFPSNIIAGMFGFNEEPFFEIDPAEKELVHKAPDVSFDTK
jgi:LemA protein